MVDARWRHRVVDPAGPRGVVLPVVPGASTAGGASVGASDPRGVRPGDLDEARRAVVRAARRDPASS